MVLSCVAYGCTYRFKKGSEFGFFRFPRDEKRRQMWIRALCRKDWQPSEGSRICGKHFISGAPAPLEDTSNPDWVPCINLGHNYFEKGDGALKRYHKNAEKVAEGFSSLEDDDEEEKVEIHKQLSVSGESKNAHVENMSSHRSNEDLLKYFIFYGPHDRNQTCSVTHEALNATETHQTCSVTHDEALNAAETHQTCSVTHDEALNAAETHQTCSVTHDQALKATETLLHYMENQDNVDHADLIIIRGYRRRILENMKLAK